MNPSGIRIMKTHGRSMDDRFSSDWLKCDAKTGKLIPGSPGGRQAISSAVANEVPTTRSRQAADDDADKSACRCASGIYTLNWEGPQNRPHEPSLCHSERRDPQLPYRRADRLSWDCRNSVV